MDRLSRLKEDTNRAEMSLQAIFENMIAKIRDNFSATSNLIRSDFESLQRQE